MRKVVKGLAYAIISRHPDSNTHTCDSSVLMNSNVITSNSLPFVVPPVTKEVKMVWEDPVPSKAAHERVV